MMLGTMALAALVSGDAWAQAYPTDPGDVTITEFMAEPTVVPNYYGEWFELYNASGRNLDLNGLKIQGDSAEDVGFTITTSLTVAAGGFVVLGVNADTGLNGGVDVDYAYSRASFVLNENEDTVKLVYGTVTLDQLTWDSADWEIVKNYAHQANNNAFDLEWANDLSHNWCVADTLYSGSMYGTPGESNDWCNESNDDADGDGYTEATGDCDDQDPYVNEDAIDGTEDPYGVSGDDADCDGVRDDGDVDNDGDGYSEVGGDCNDADPTLNPDQKEVNDGEDNDCNGCIDDLDLDDDGWTDCPGAHDPIDCDGDGEDDIQDPVDCFEGDNLVYPCATEIPYNAVDDDCDGFDECDSDGDGYKADPDIYCPGEDCCQYSDGRPGDDCDDTNPSVSPGQTEGDPEQGGSADGLDNDCDGIVDNPYQDLDGDGWSIADGDCWDEPDNAEAARVNPDAEELCNDLIDNNCDGFFNEMCSDAKGLAGVRGGGAFCGVAPIPGAAAGSSVLLLALGLFVTGVRRREGEGQ